MIRCLQRVRGDVGLPRVPGRGEGDQPGGPGDLQVCAPPAPAVHLHLHLPLHLHLTHICHTPGLHLPYTCPCTCTLLTSVLTPGSYTCLTPAPAPALHLSYTWPHLNRHLPCIFTCTSTPPGHSLQGYQSIQKGIPFQIKGSGQSKLFESV
jgi:hypothetical protein